VAGFRPDAAKKVADLRDYELNIAPKTLQMDTSARSRVGLNSAPRCRSAGSWESDREQTPYRDELVHRAAGVKERAHEDPRPHGLGTIWNERPLNPKSVAG